MLENLSLGIEIGILKVLKFSDEKLWPYNTGFLWTLQHWVFVTCMEGIEFHFHDFTVNLTRESLRP